MPDPIHIITSEYPPTSGGVSDYTQTLAATLAQHSWPVHVWCPGGVEARVATPGVVVHDSCGTFTRADLAGLHETLDRHRSPRHLFVQWVPHGYGRRAMNVGFTSWLRQRALRGDRVDVMVHEPFMPFTWMFAKRNLPALVQRSMMVTIMRFATRVWVSTPAWIPRIRPYAFGRRVPIDWLPLGATLRHIGGGEGLRRSLPSSDGSNASLVIGHFGSFEPQGVQLLMGIVPQLMRREPDATILLMGKGSQECAGRLLRLCPDLTSRILATGFLPADDIVRNLQMCDLLVQPFSDGVTFRRTTVMNALAMGIPVVTTQGRLTEPWWSTSESVALAPAFDATASVEMASELLRNESKRLTLGRGGAAAFARHFAIEVAVAKLSQQSVGGCLPVRG